MKYESHMPNFRIRSIELRGDILAKLKTSKPEISASLLNQ